MCYGYITNVLGNILTKTIRVNIKLCRFFEYLCPCLFAIIFIRKSYR